MSGYRVRVRVGQVEVEAESNEGEYVDAKIAELLGKYVPLGQDNGITAPMSGKSPKKESLNEFIAKTNPGSATEYAIVIAYYLENVVGVSEITVKEIREGFRVARFSHSNPSQALVDAKSQRYFMQGSGPKLYTLTKTGEQWVVDRLRARSGE